MLGSAAAGGREPAGDCESEAWPSDACSAAEAEELRVDGRRGGAMDDGDLLMKTAGTQGGVVAVGSLQKPEHGHELLVVSVFELNQQQPPVRRESIRSCRRGPLSVDCAKEYPGMIFPEKYDTPGIDPCPPPDLIHLLQRNTKGITTVPLTRILVQYLKVPRYVLNTGSGGEK